MQQLFGTKVEPALVTDPMIHAICVGLRTVDPGDGNAFRDRLFDAEHPPVAPAARSLKLDLSINSQALELDIEYSIKGKIRLEYNRKKVALLSRAIHKLGSESFVWHFLQGHIEAPVDPFSTQFCSIKQWVREGQPHPKVRPFARMPAPGISHEWETRLWQYDGQLALEIRLFGDWFAVSLTSDQSDAPDHLRDWCSRSSQKGWLIGERFEPIAGGI